MSGQMKSYKHYLNILNSMEEPIVPKAKLDMRGLRAYAASKNSAPNDLSQKEREMFIQYLHDTPEA